jgi:hypothetical protein
MASVGLATLGDGNMTVSAGNVIPSKKIIFPLSVATGRKKAISPRLVLVFRPTLVVKIKKWDVSTRWRQKAGILFLEGMTFPAETVINPFLVDSGNFTFEENANNFIFNLKGTTGFFVVVPT